MANEAMLPLLNMLIFVVIYESSRLLSQEETTLAHSNPPRNQMECCSR